MGFFKKLFGVKTFQIALEKPFTIEFYYNEHFEDIFKINDSINLWNKKGTTEICAYPKHSAGSLSYIGYANNEIIQKHLEKGGKYEAEIIKVEAGIVVLNVILKNIFQTKDDYKSEQTSKRVEELNKPCKPKSSWTLRFRTDNFNKENGYYLCTSSKEDIFNNPDDLQKLVWLEDNFGEVIEYANSSSPKDLLKTLRAVLSGVELDISHSNSLDSYHSFEITPK